MKGFNPHNRAAFQPPSDMVNDGSGSSTTKKVFVGLGIGCGIILIIIGIMFAAGAFKAVTCCNQFQDIASTSMASEQFGKDFAAEVYAGELDAAYARTSSKYQEDVPLQQFKKAVNVHRDRIDANQPRMFEMNLEQQGGDKPSLETLSKGTWRMSYQFAGPQDETMLLMIVRVARVEGADDEFEIQEVKFDERPRNLAHEPPAAEVLRVHDMLQRGQYALAYRRMGQPFQAQSDSDAWDTFLDETGDVLTSSTLEIREVSYNDANTQATVMAHAKAASGQNAIVQFELQPMQQELPGFGWRIVAISPTITETPGTETAPGATNNGTTGATNAGTSGTTGTTGAQPPTVDVQE